MLPEYSVPASQGIVIIEHYRSSIFAFFQRKLGDREDAEDATQDVCAKLSRMAELEHIENIQGYIFRAAANHLRDRARRARARPLIESEGAADPHERLINEISPERELIGRENYKAFLAALRELPERPRTIFILNRFEEMPGREIAQRLDISQRLVEKEISRVLSFLRERLS